MSKFPHNTKYAVLLVFYNLLVKYKNTYCFPTRQTILNHLEKFYKIVITLSCLDQHLAELRDCGLIKSFRRWGRKPDGTIYNLPSNRSVTLLGFKSIRMYGKKVTGFLWRWATTGIGPRKTRGPDLDKTSESIKARSGDAESLGTILDKMVIPDIV